MWIGYGTFGGDRCFSCIGRPVSKYLLMVIGDFALGTTWLCSILGSVVTKDNYGVGRVLGLLVKCSF